MLEITYDVFARKNRGDLLSHIGYVDAETAKVYAWTTYSEENWFEMCVVPRSEIIPVNLTEGPFARAQGATE